MGFDISFMFIALKEAIKYIPITLMLAIIPFIIGIVVGVLLYLSMIGRRKRISGFIRL